MFNIKECIRINEQNEVFKCRRNVHTSVSVTSFMCYLIRDLGNYKVFLLTLSLQLNYMSLKWRNNPYISKNTPASPSFQISQKLNIMLVFALFSYKGVPTFTWFGCVYSVMIFRIHADSDRYNKCLWNKIMARPNLQ